MEILDIHTHRLPQPPFNAIWNCMLKDGIPHQERVGYFSAGIHPWYLSEDNLSMQEEWLEELVRDSCRIVAIGEAGLDKATDVPWNLQMKAFEWQIELADKMGLPLILHVVKAHNEVIELKKLYHPHNPWIVHGFRGKRQLAESYLKEGVSLSFGVYYNEETLRATPRNKMFFETDDNPESIYDVYKRAAMTLDFPLERLIQQSKQNITKLFFPLNYSSNL